LSERSETKRGSARATPHSNTRVVERAERDETRFRPRDAALRSSPRFVSSLRSSLNDPKVPSQTPGA